MEGRRDVHVFLGGGSVWFATPTCAGEWHRGSACLGVNGLPHLVSPWLGQADLAGSCQVLVCAAFSCRAGKTAIAQLCTALQLLLALVE